MEVRINGYFIENNKGQDFIEANDSVIRILVYSVDLYLF